MARRLGLDGSGSVGTLESTDERRLIRQATKAVNSGIPNGKTIHMFFRDSQGHKLNQSASAERPVAIAVARGLVQKGWVPS